MVMNRHLFYKNNNCLLNPPHRFQNRESIPVPLRGGELLEPFGEIFLKLRLIFVIGIKSLKPTDINPLSRGVDFARVGAKAGVCFEQIIL